MQHNDKSLKELVLPIDVAPLKVTSPVFMEGGLIPLQYTCDGANISPSLDIAGIPAATKSLAIIVLDPDAPEGPFVHWLAWNIPVVKHIPDARHMEAQGYNDFHVAQYKGPCPPLGTHHYHFTVYALDNLLNLTGYVRAGDLETAMNGHILGLGRTTGLYKRK